MPQTDQTLSDRYHLQKKLGQDASRQTWLAIDTAAQPPETVVVKLLAFDPQMQWEESKLFEREAQVLQRLDHPRIPKYRNYFTLDHLPDSRFPWFGLVQSYIPGRSLQELLDQRQRFSAARVEKIAIEVLSILVYLHELAPPMLHRDIKPSNLIWGEDERLYLVDFGAVQDQAATEGATFTIVGTYGYVPMEQFGGRAVAASDLYALGATLIHLLTGLAPADLPQHDGRMQFADGLQPGFAHCLNLDSGLVNWICKLTEPNLADRFSTARQALAALDQRHTLSSPTLTPKPSGSNIQIRKSASQLDIKIPHRGVQALSFAYVLGAGAALAFPLLQLSRFLPIVFHSLNLALVTIPLILVALSPAFQRTHLAFDGTHLVIRQELFGICYKHQRIPLLAIETVASGGELVNLLRGTLPPDELEAWIAKHDDRLVIRANKKLYVTNPLSKIERLWLTQEISNWLKAIRKSQASASQD